MIWIFLFKTQSEQICDPPAAMQLFRGHIFFVCICRLLCRYSSFLSFTQSLHLTHTPLSDCSGRQACFTFCLWSRVAFSCWKADYSQGRSACLESFIPDEQHSLLWPWNHRNLLLPLSLSHMHKLESDVYIGLSKKKSCCFEETPKNRDTFLWSIQFQSFQSQFRSLLFHYIGLFCIYFALINR